MKVGSRTVEIGNPDKVLFPDDGITKQDLAEYYLWAAEWMVPHVRDRLVSMHRFPDGIGEDGFYQKNVPEYFPDWIETHAVRTRQGDSLRQLTIQDAATLVYLADQGCITPHVWTSRVDGIEAPDRIVFDFDPAGEGKAEDSFDRVRWAARRVRELVEEVGLVPFVQTSGSRGLHIHVPLRRGPGFDEVLKFSRDLAGLLAERHPDRLTVAQRKEKRGDRIFLDMGRNAYGQTAVAPYAVRARAGAPIATPLGWEELDRSDLHPRRYSLANIKRRLAQTSDPWQAIGQRARSLQSAREKLDELLRD